MLPNQKGDLIKHLSKTDNEELEKLAFIFGGEANVIEMFKTMIVRTAAGDPKKIEAGVFFLAVLQEQFNRIRRIKEAESILLKIK